TCSSEPSLARPGRRDWCSSPTRSSPALAAGADAQRRCPAKPRGRPVRSGSWSLPLARWIGRLHTEGGQLAPQVVVRVVNDALPTTGSRSLHVGRQVVDEQTFRRGTAGALLAQLKNAWVRLAQAYLKRQNQAIEPFQRRGELPAKLPGVNLVRVAQQKQPMARLQARHEIANALVGPKHVAQSGRELLVGASQVKRLADQGGQRGRADLAGFVVVL